MSSVLDGPKTLVRRVMHYLARLLNSMSGGKLSPHAITLVSLAMHIPIAWLIAMQSYYWAAGLLLIFGLFDTLDGELARLQGKASNLGMFLDSTTDRIKEILLYSGAAYAFVANGQTYLAVWATAACGIALLVSYINAWGEVVLSRQPVRDHQINKSLRGGLMGFEIRISVLILGLVFNRLGIAVVTIAILAAITALQRISNVTKKLHV